MIANIFNTKWKEDGMMPKLILGGIILGCVITTALMKNGLNMIFLGIMLFIVGLAYIKPFRELNKLKGDLKRGTAYIKELSAKTNVSTWEALRDSDFMFEHVMLQECFLAYKQEMDRLYTCNKQMTTCDVADYINEDLVNRVMMKHFNDQIAGALTGLGILGTFIGLTIGLQNFNTADVATMTISIQTLIEGIKVAFCTSIFGVSLSLGFTILYKDQQEAGLDALDAFCDAFYAYVVPNSDNAVVNKLMGYQERQADSMAQFAESISLELAKSLNHYVAPTMERLTDVIDQIAVNATANQQVGIEKIVNSFIVQLNQLMGNQFENLGLTIEKLCDWQEATMIELKKVTDEVCYTAKDIQVVNEHSERIIENMDGYTGKLHSMQNEMNELMNKLTEQTSYIGINYEKYHGLVEGLMEQEKSVQDAIINLSQETTTYVEQINGNMSDHTALINESKEALVDMIETTKESAKSIREASEQQSQRIDRMSEEVAQQVKHLLDKQVAQFDHAVERLAQEIVVVKETLDQAYSGFDQDMGNALNRTFESFDQNLSEICHHLSGTIAEIKQVSQNVPSIINLAYENMHEQLSKYVQVVDSMSVEAEKLMRHTSEQIHRVNEGV